MKAYNPKTVAKAVEESEATFKESTLNRIKDILTPWIPETAIEDVNIALAARKKRPLTIEDYAKVAYVHCRSIAEHEDGASPTKRITKYYEANDATIDRMHVKVITDTLVAIEFLTLNDGDWGPKKCRCYSLPKDVQVATGIKPKPLPEHK